MFSPLRTAAFVGVLCAAGAADAQSLSKTLASAYANNPSLNSARALTRATHEGVAIARGAFRPQVFGTSTTALESTATTPGTEGTGIESTLGINVDQTLFNGFQRVNATRGAESDVRAQQEALRSQEQTTLLDAVTAFADVIQDEEILRLNRANLEFLDEQVRASQDRFDVGEGTRTDISQAQADRQSALSDVLSAEANLASSRATFFQVTGIRAQNLRRDIKIRRHLPKSLKSALTTSAREHPDIVSALHSVDSAEFNVKEQEGALLPTVSLEGSASTTFQPVGAGSVTDRVDNGSVGLTLSVPLYQGGIVSAQVRQAKEQLGQARIDVDVARDVIRQSVVSTWNNLLAANASIRAAQAGVRAAELALEGVIEEQRVGQRTRLDILDQQSTLISAQITLAQAQRNQLVFAYSLLSTIGRLSAQRLNLSVALHVPQKHYQKVRDKWLGLRTPDGR